MPATFRFHIIFPHTQVRTQPKPQEIHLHVKEAYSRYEERVQATQVQEEDWFHVALWYSNTKRPFYLRVKRRDMDERLAEAYFLLFDKMNDAQFEGEGELVNDHRFLAMSQLRDILRGYAERIAVLWDLEDVNTEYFDALDSCDEAELEWGLTDHDH